MESALEVLLLDSHVAYWWFAEPGRLSAPALTAMQETDQLAIAAITWFELAWMIEHNRVVIDIPLRTWLDTVSQDLTTLEVTPAIAATAVTLPEAFSGDPMDRLIYATAIEEGLQLVTRDESMRRHPHPRQITIW